MVAGRFAALLLVGVAHCVALIPNARQHDATHRRLGADLVLFQVLLVETQAMLVGCPGPSNPQIANIRILGSKLVESGFEKCRFRKLSFRVKATHGDQIWFRKMSISKIFAKQPKFVQNH